MKSQRKKVAGITLVLVGVVTMLAAWANPAPSGDGAACAVNGTRAPLHWSIINKENGFPGSPGLITDVGITPSNFGTPVFSPNPLANDGVSEAKADTDVPVDFTGDVTLKFSFVFSGTSGGDSKGPFYVTVHVNKCDQPTTTTILITTTTSSSTTTSEATTTTTMIVTTTSTEQTTTTTEESTTTTSEQTTTTTAPSTTTTAHVTTTTAPCDVTTTTASGPCSTTTTAKQSTSTTSCDSTTQPGQTVTKDSNNVCSVFVPPVAAASPTPPTGAALPVTGTDMRFVIGGLALLLAGLCLTLASTYRKPQAI